MQRRRSFMKTLLSAGAGATLSSIPLSRGGGRGSTARFRQSVSKWCYSDFTVEELAVAGKEMGLQSIELLNPDQWSAVETQGLTCAMANGPWTGERGIRQGWNNPENHADLIPLYKEHIRKVSEAGLPNLICFSGNRSGFSEEEGLRNCADGLTQIVGTAEEHGVTLCMELLNSKVDHPGYQCDHTTWGVDLVERVGSDHFRLLYDIYHMQIMEGDVIRTIRNHHDAIAHYHTGGVPGRNEIDETQELNYPAIMRSIAETGFEGFVGHEFIPTREPLESLKQGIDICTI